jgi:hypothetical protein
MPKSFLATSNSPSFTIVVSLSCTHGNFIQLCLQYLFKPQGPLLVPKKAQEHQDTQKKVNGQKSKRLFAPFGGSSSFL